MRNVQFDLRTVLSPDECRYRLERHTVKEPRYFESMLRGAALRRSRDGNPSIIGKFSDTQIRLTVNRGKYSEPEYDVNLSSDDHGGTLIHSKRINNRFTLIMKTLVALAWMALLITMPGSDTGPLHFRTAAELHERLFVVAFFGSVMVLALFVLPYIIDIIDRKILKQFLIRVLAAEELTADY